MQVTKNYQTNTCVKDFTKESSIFNKSAKPILKKINKLIFEDIENEEDDFLELLDSLEKHYIDSSVINKTEEMKKAFENIMGLDFHCNKDVLYDFEGALFEELSYCLKRQNKGGKGYFTNFNQFESFLGVKQNSLHQILFDKTYNFNKINKTTYNKLIKFLNLFSDVNELNESLIKCSDIWLKQKPINKIESGALSIKLFEILDKSSYFNNSHNQDIELIIYKNKFRSIIKNLINTADIEKISEKTKMPLLLEMIA